MRAAAAALSAAAAAAAQGLGPGSGPWRTATPESQGLSAEELAAAEARVHASVPGRVGFVVVKNGVIVHETYRDGWTESSTRAAASCTKSLCSSLYGIARQQGWADPAERVAARNAGTLSCNPAAEFSHVLTMTGESADLSHPTFSYDASGLLCLDTLSYFIGQNNPDGVSTKEWKDRYWQGVLGLEHSTWDNLLPGVLPCGFGFDASCRDLARTAQLWANQGEWPGHGQLMSRQHAIDGRKWVYPTSGTEYGYTVWLQVHDPVDPEVHSFMGAASNCAHVSVEHNTVIVSMGAGDAGGALCMLAWAETRHAIVSRDHARYNATRRAGPLRPEERAALTNNTYVSPAEIAAFNEYLKKQGKEPLQA